MRRIRSVLIVFETMSDAIVSGDSRSRFVFIIFYRQESNRRATTAHFDTSSFCVYVFFSRHFINAEYELNI